MVGDRFTSSLIDLWFFKDFKQCYNYKESETQQGTCDKDRIIGMDKSKEGVPNSLACTNIGNLPTGKTKQKGKPQTFGPFNTRTFQQRNPVGLVPRIRDGRQGILDSIPGQGKETSLFSRWYRSTATASYAICAEMRAVRNLSKTHTLI
jgi:hypothetical protein